MLAGVDHLLFSRGSWVHLRTTSPATFPNSPDFALRGGGCRPSQTLVRPYVEVQTHKTLDAPRSFSDPKLEDAWKALRHFFARSHSDNAIKHVKVQLSLTSHFDPRDLQLFIVNLLRELTICLRDNILPRCTFELPKLALRFLCLLFGQEHVEVTSIVKAVQSVEREKLPELLGSQELDYYLKLVTELCGLLERPCSELKRLRRFGKFYFHRNRWTSEQKKLFTDRDWTILKVNGCSDDLIVYLQSQQAIIESKDSASHPEEQSRIFKYWFERCQTATVPLILSMYYFGRHIHDKALFRKVIDYTCAACDEEEMRRPALLLLLYLAAREDDLPVPRLKQTVLKFLEHRKSRYLNSDLFAVKGFVLEPEWFVPLLSKHLVLPHDRKQFWIKLCGIDPSTRKQYLLFMKQQLKPGYVDLEVTEGLSLHLQSYSIDERIRSFLTHPSQKVAVLLGEPGSGKSLFSLKLCADLLAAGLEWLPFYIYLPEHQDEQGQILDTVIKERKLLPRAQVMKHRKILFILDAYDEVTIEQVNYIVETRVFKHFPMSKVLFTCRTNEVHSFLTFLPNKQVGVPQASFVTLYIRPFTPEKLEEFVWKRKGVEAIVVLNKIQKILSLESLLDTPYLLNLCVSSDELLEKLSSIHGTVKRCHIYEKFTEVVQDQALKSSRVDFESEEASQLREKYTEVSYRFAFIALRFGVIDRRNLAVTAEDLRFVYGCPIVPIPREGGKFETRYKFIHPSHMDYLVAEATVAELGNSAAGTLSADALINQYDLVPRVNARNFIVERVQGQRTDFQQILLDIILQTRKRCDITQASANAITLLNQMKYSLAGAKLEEVKISGANLSGANLNETSLQKSELIGVKLENCQLTNTNLKEANLAQVKFGRRAPLQGHSWRVNAICFSPDGAFIASGSQDKSIIIWEVASTQQYLTLAGHTDEVTTVSFSPRGKTLISGSADNTLILWKTRTGEQLRVLKGHTDSVTAASFTPDGKLIVSGSQDNSLVVWEATTGHSLRRMQGSSSTDFAGVTALSVSPDGSLIASGSHDNTITIWNSSADPPLRTLSGHSSSLFGGVTAVSFSPDGTLIASGSADNTVIVWTAATGKLVRILQGHSSSVNAVCYSPDGALILSGSQDNTVVVWEAASGQQLRTLQGHSGVVTALSTSPDGLLVASGSQDCTVIIWEVATIQHIQRTPGHTAFVNAVTFSHDSALLATGSEDATVIVWELSSGQPICTLKGHSLPVSAVCFSSDGALIVSGSWDNTVIIWDATTKHPLHTLQGHSSSLFGGVTAVSISLDAALIASGGADNTIVVWDTASGQRLRTLEGHSGCVTAVDISPAGDLIVSGSEDTLLIVWETATGQETGRLHGHSLQVSGVIFSLTGTLILSGSWDKTLSLWETATGKQLSTFHGHIDRVTSVAFSPNSSLIISGSKDATVIVWETATGNRVRTLQGHSSAVSAVCVSPSTAFIASGSQDNTVIVWEMTSNKQVQTLKRKSSFVNVVSFSPDGRLLASGRIDNSVTVWEAATGLQVRSYHGHSLPVLAVSFSSDGAFIASGSEDRSVVVWETETGQLVCSFQGHTVQVNAVCFSPDGSLVASGSSDGIVIVWDMRSAQKIRLFQGHSEPVLSLSFLSSITIRSFTMHYEFTWSLTLTRGFYSKDLNLILFEKDSGFDCWDVRTGKSVPYTAQHIEVGPAIVYNQVPHLKIHKQLGNAGLACYGLQLDGAILSKADSDLLNSLALKAS